MMQKIFAYCERGLDPGYWAEPINAVTNAAFIIAGLAALMLWRAPRGMLAGIPELLLIIIVFAIGTGSYLFHTHAEGWSALADTLPIGIFMVSYLAYALRRFLRWDWINIAVAMVGFVFLLGVASMTRCDGGACYNGSAAYFPALLALLMIGAWLIVVGYGAGAYVFGAGLVFTASLVFRSIDRAVCPDTIVAPMGPIGTHFIWHVLNATLLYLLLRAAILYGPKLAPDKRPPRRRDLFA